LPQINIQNYNSYQINTNNPNLPNNVRINPHYKRLQNYGKVNTQNFYLNNPVTNNQIQPQQQAHSHSTKSYRTQKIKINSIPMGNVFKNMGELIPFDNLGIIINKLPLKSN
jgi:hypothetical protein